MKRGLIVLLLTGVAIVVAGTIIVARRPSPVAQTPSVPEPTTALPAPSATPTQAATQAPAVAPSQGTDAGQSFRPEELEQIVAPIALYPDSLLAQILMASTYPLEVVEAARWSKANPQVTGDAVAYEMEKQRWDPAVKSLVAFPDVLAMMNEKLDWTQKLGDAFLAQQKDVMDAAQRLRNKAVQAGNLKTSREQTVKTEPAPAGAPAPQVVVIESPNPTVVYVPTYDPTVVYGAWPYPAYPPYYYYPPGYAAGAALFSFSVGVFVGSALWGGCNWGHSDIDINVNRYNNFNRNEINYNRNNINNGKWQHNAEHRKGVGYRDSATQQKYGRASSQQGLQSREQFRGHAEQGRQEIAREGAANQRDLSGNSIGTREGYGGESRDFSGRDVNSGQRDVGSQSRDYGGSQSRDLGGSQNRDYGGSQSRDLGGSQSRDYGSSQSRDYGGSQNRDYGSSSRSSDDAFTGVGNASSTRSSSSRGGASRGGSRGGGGRRR